MGMFSKDKDEFEIMLERARMDREANQRDPIYIFTNKTLVKFFYEKNKELLELILKTDLNYLNFLYNNQEACKMFRNDYADFTFPIKTYTNESDDTIIRIQLPEPVRSAMSFYVLLRFDKNGNAINYYTIEKSQGEDIFLCSYKKDGTHIKHQSVIDLEKDISFIGNETTTNQNKLKAIENSTKFDNINNKNVSNNSGNSEDKIVFCRKCGFKLLEDSVYCSNCGTKVF